MLKKLSQLHRSQKGITGLETAIILIAFVVVAAVFAYTALSAGLFSTQKSQEAVYSGLEEARSTLVLKGGVIAKDTDSPADNYVDTITFTVANALSGEAIDFTAPADDDSNGLADSDSNNVVVISYIDSGHRVEDLYWTKTAIGSDDGDDLLEAGEKFQITIPRLEASGTGLNNVIGTNHTFTIEVKTPNGATLNIERTTPGNIDDVMNLN